MTDTPHLDRAIQTAKRAEWVHHDLPLEALNRVTVEGDRVHARALVASLLEGMDQGNPFETAKAAASTYNDGFKVGYQLALEHIRNRAGLEVGRCLV
jgi:hypothetical protein